MPYTFRLADNHSVTIAPCLFGQSRDMRTAHHHFDISLFVKCRKIVGFLDLRAVAGNSCQINIERPVGVCYICDFVVTNVVSCAGHTSQGQKAKAGKGRDNFAAFYETRKRQAKRKKLLITSPDTAHRNKRYFHTPASLKTTYNDAANTQKTGGGKNLFVF